MKAILRYFASWTIFFLLWLLFVYQTSSSELLAGVGAAVLASVASEITLKVEPFRFQPRLAWLAQMWRLPLLILEDFRVLLRVLTRRLLGKPVPGTLQLAQFHSSGYDSQEGARCALAVLLLSLSPNSVVIGIDQNRGMMLLHQLLPAPVPELISKLED